VNAALAVDFICNLRTSFAVDSLYLLQTAFWEFNFALLLQHGGISRRDDANAGGRAQ
jgi:hypothetical protein